MKALCLNKISKVALDKLEELVKEIAKTTNK